MPCVPPKRLAAGCGLMLWLAVAGLGGESRSPAELFLSALRSPAATAEQRRQAWEALREDKGPVPKSVASAIDKSRRAAWSRLRALVASAAVRRVAGSLRRRIVPHQAKARAVVAGVGFSKQKLDKAMEPIQQALDEAVEALHEAKGFDETLGLINELEAYSADARLRTGWNDGLGDVLCTLRLVAHYAAGKATHEVLLYNRKAGALIDPDEQACVARLNVHRLLLGLPPVAIDLRLVMAAKKHCEEMAAKGYFSHQSPTPHRASPGQRAGREGATWSGECIAAGSRSGVGAFRMWYYSQGHHRIMINRSRAIGVGRAGNKFTLMMGRSRVRGAAAGKFIAYVKQRYRAGDDAAKLYDLARWCTAAGLTNQAVDELERVVALDPENERAAKALAKLRTRNR